MTDDHFSYKHSRDVAAVLADLGARPVFIKAHCPWQNGKVERLNRTLQTEWAYRQVFTSNAQRAAALALLQHSTTPQRTRRPPAAQPTVTNLVTEYS
jgi:transposase InsO family protein